MVSVSSSIGNTMIPPHCHQHWPSLSCLTVFQFNSCCDLTFLCFPPVSIFSSKSHPFNTAFRWGCSVTSLCLGSHVCLYHLVNCWFLPYWFSDRVPMILRVSSSACSLFGFSFWMWQVQVFDYFYVDIFFKDIFLFVGGLDVVCGHVTCVGVLRGRKVVTDPCWSCELPKVLRKASALLRDPPLHCGHPFLVNYFFVY